MVDSITGSSSTQAVQAARRVEQNTQQREAEQVSEARDSVEISAEAAELAAQAQARDVRASLEANPRQSLGLNPNFDTSV